MPNPNSIHMLDSKSLKDYDHKNYEENGDSDEENPLDEGDEDIDWELNFWF